MKYTHEFQVIQYGRKGNEMDEEIKYRRHTGAANLGVLIGNNVQLTRIIQAGVQRDPFPYPHHSKFAYGPEDYLRFKIEVQAFDENDWRQFKQDLLKLIEAMETLYPGVSMLNKIGVGKLITELENKVHGKSTNAEHQTGADDAG